MFKDDRKFFLYLFGIAGVFTSFMLLFVNPFLNPPNYTEILPLPYVDGLAIILGGFGVMCIGGASACTLEEK